MNAPQPTLFDSERMSAEAALELTAQSLRAWGATHRHWCIAYSGGKDSSATVTAVCHLIANGRVPAPESLTILYAVTRRLARAIVTASIRQDPDVSFLEDAALSTAA